MSNKERLIYSFFFLHFLLLPTYLIANDRPKVTLGGALRFNYNYSNWKEESKNKGGDFGFDVFRLNVNATYGNLYLDADYRMYPKSSGGNFLKHGWVGYKFNKQNELQLGLTQVPFGIQPYTANNFFFNMNYYLGLEDDADMGVKYLYSNNHWDLAFAFFKNADVTDFGSSHSLSRYGYDIVARNKENNQGNIQVAYNWGGPAQQQIGLSGLLGGIYNLDTKKNGTRAALAAHYTLAFMNWKLGLQYTTYTMSPKNKEDDPKDVISMGAYGGEYWIANRAETYTATLAYIIPYSKGLLDQIQVYNDFSMMHKKIRGFRDSYQNITGCMITTGPLVTYIEYALGKNHALFGNEWSNSFASGDPENKWNGRFNINIGYYF